jgi:uncharacterized Rmd1/YagE family protein
MTPINFKAVSLCNEINLNTIAAHFGINKKFEWEDFLRLNTHQLKGILKDHENKSVNIFAFGCLVFVNLEHHEIMDVLNYLITLEPRLQINNFDFADDYMLDVRNENDLSEDEALFTNESMITTEYGVYQMDILSIVLAKSVALEKIESDTEILLDEIELVINAMQTGQLSARDEKIARISARILNFKYNTISSIMILDKPDITWNNAKAESLYSAMSHLFELDERYNKVQMKAETLMDIVQVFTTFTQHKKANTLEMMIIILIIIEIIISLIEFFHLNPFSPL